MASVGKTSASQAISPSFEKLLQEITANLSPEELKHAVSSIKTNFEGKFNAKDDQDLYSCLHLFANQGVISEDNLTLLEKFVVTPHTSNKATIEDKIHNFKATRPFQEPRKQELTGRNRDLTNVISMLTTDRSSVLNLYGSSGVGKTRLATEAFSQWSGPKFKVDLREIDEMKDVHFQVFLALSERSGLVEVSYEANTVIAKMEQVKQNSEEDILLFLDNADKFIAAANELNASFGSLLDRLLGAPSGKTTRTNLKILLTSRCEFRHGTSLKVQNHELRALERESSDQLLQSQGRISQVPISQREKLVDMCKGKPLLLNGMAAILRQEIADAERLLGTIEQELDVPLTLETGPASKETEKVERFDVKEEGIDQEQLSCLRKIFFFLPSITLKESAVSLSLFCRPFTVETAAKILDVDSSEAAVRLEGLRNSQVITVTEDKELYYDIHPLMRNFLKSIGNGKMFSKAFEKSKENFSKHFVSRLTELSSLLDKDFVKASESFEIEKENFELALDISLKSDFLLISKEHHESLMICYFLEAMLDANQRRRIFRSWGDKAMEDSVFRSEMRCQEALQVLKLEGWRKAAEVLKEAKEILSRMPKDSKKTDSFKLARSLFLFAEGEVYYAGGNFPRALKALNKSLKIMEVLLKSHTSTSRCLNVIGDCYIKLKQPKEAIKYYQKASAMRKDLSPSGEHCDMPLFQSQIGTVYEAQKKFHEAIDHYKEALDLATKLKLPGVLYTALYNRKIGNAYAWLEQYDQAYEYAKKAYDIRKDVLSNHPLTARSAFQMAEICRYLDEFDEADEYYEEAWEIEKSLGQGNHSEVRDRIIASYRKQLSGRRKKVFEEEVFEFYKRCWDEERSCEDFAFTQANKNIIDYINERLESGEGDKERKKKYQREALWFYEGTWKSADTKRLPYEFREDILTTLLRLCDILGEEELLRKYKVDEFKFCEKRWKKDRKYMKHPDKYDILSTLVDRATFLCYDEKVVKYSKLLQEVKKPTASYLRSLLPFRSAAPDKDQDDDISDESDMEAGGTVGNDVDDDDDDDDEVGGEEKNKEEEGDKEVFGGNEEEHGEGGVYTEEVETHEQWEYEQDSTDSEFCEELTQTTVQDVTQEIHSLQLKEQEEPIEEHPEKTTIFEGEVTSEGIHLDLYLGGVHLTFPPGTVSEPTTIMVHRWKYGACLPTLGEHEAVVSNVIEISANEEVEALEFKDEVKLALSHSAPDLEGYELVIKKLLDAKSNEWEEVDGCENIRGISDIEDDYPTTDKVPNLLFPVVQAGILECSTYAVVSRLKVSPTYTITVSGGTFGHPNYPQVAITVPKKAVGIKTKLPLQLKVQEVPQGEFQDLDLFAGPILRILGSPKAEFLKPVTIQLPVCLREKEMTIPDPSMCRVRIFFLHSETESKEWSEISSDLENPATYDGKVVKFQVRRFSGYACFLDWCGDDLRTKAYNVIDYLWSIIRTQPLEANFFAYFHPNTRPNCQDILHLICCPAHLRKQVKEEIVAEIGKEGIRNCKEVSSKRTMIPERDKAFVSVSGGIKTLGDTEDFYLRFNGKTEIRDQLDVRVIDEEVDAKVEFRSTTETTGKNLLNKLKLPLSTPSIDDQEVEEPSGCYLRSSLPFGAGAPDKDDDDDISDESDMEGDGAAGDDEDEMMEQLEEEEGKEEEEEEEEEVLSTSVGASEISSDNENEFLGDFSNTNSESIILYRGEAVAHCSLKHVGLHVFFPPDVVSGGRISTVRRWNPRLRSPPLLDNEAVVSDVIELSLDSPGDLQFDRALTLVIPHCASDLKGYEVVVKCLSIGDEWKGVETADWRTKSDIKEDYDLPGYVPDFFPVAACHITQCSTFAVVCRPTSHRHAVTSEQSEVVWPECPLAKVTFPQNAVPQKDSFEVTAKLQEVSHRQFRQMQIQLGPDSVFSVYGPKDGEVNLRFRCTSITSCQLDDSCLDLKNTPVEFFGLPFDDSILLEAPFQGCYGILTACKGVLHEIRQGHIYDHHKDLVSKEPETEVKKSFLMELSRLDLEHKQRCFDEIVSTLKKGGEGLKRIRDRLIEAENKINRPINNGVCNVVADRFKHHGTYWKTLARDLQPEIPESDIFDAQNNEGSPKECCRVVLKRWFEKHSSSATNKELMRCLTNMGLANVNWQIMRKLGLVELKNIPLSER